MACRLIWTIALCAFVITAAQITTPATANPRAALTLMPAVGPPTASTTVRGTGYAGREVVAVRFDGVHVGSAVAGAAGKFSVDVIVPSSALPGLHTVEAIGETSGSSARAPFRVRTDWLQGCFDAAQTCFNPYENVIDAGNAAALAPAWRTRVGTDGRSAPVYANGRLFIGTVTGLVGLDPASGAIIINDHSGPVSATPAVIRGFDPQPDPPGKVIFGTRDGTLHALSTSGAPLWQAWLGAAPASPVVLQFPGVPGSRIFVGAGNRLFALDGDGKRLWTTVLEGGDISRGAAVFTAPPEPERVIVPAGNRLYALDAATGAVLWSVVPSGSRLGAPSFGDPNVLVGDQAGTLFSIDARRGALRSRFPATGPISGSPAIGDPNQPGPRVFVGDGGGDINAFDEVQESPAPIWQAALGGPVDGPPVLANGVLYVGTDPEAGDPHIYALERASGHVLFDAVLPGGLRSSPIVADGRLIVVTRSGEVLAYAGPDS